MPTLKSGSPPHSTTLLTKELNSEMRTSSKETALGRPQRRGSNVCPPRNVHLEVVRGEAESEQPNPRRRYSVVATLTREHTGALA